MMKKKITFIFILFLLANSSAFSQGIQNFTDSIYVRQLTEYFKTEKSADIDTFIAVDFRTAWEGGSISSTEKANIVQISNNMRIWRYSKKKYFLPFLETVLAFKKTSSANKNTWYKKVMDDVNYKKTDQRVLKEFMRQTHALIVDSLVYTSNLFKWKASSRSYSFNYNKKKKKFYISFNNTDLIGIYPKKDTIYILKTKGSYDPIEKKWRGTNGKVTWEKHKIPQGTAFATLSKYRFNMRKIEFTADTVKFIHKEFSTSPVLGRLVNKAVSVSKNSQYPAFQPYESVTNFKSKLSNVKLRGGLYMKGKHAYVGGTPELPAVAEILNDGAVLIRAKSTAFIQNDNLLKSNDATISMYVIGTDSLTHPSVRLYVNDKAIELIRRKKGAGQSLFYDSYHKTELNCDKITWIKGQKYMYLYVLRGKNGYVKSKDFFDERTFRAMQKRDATHPIISLRRFQKVLTKKDVVQYQIEKARENEYEYQNYKQVKVPQKVRARLRQKNRVFYAQEYADYLKWSRELTDERLINAWRDGFIDYNQATGRIFLKQKTFDFTNFNVKIKDYDQIVVKSETSTKEDEAFKNEVFISQQEHKFVKFAEINLENNDMQVHDVRSVSLSNKRNVAFFPDSGIVTLKKNRNMKFDGYVKAGQANIIGDSIIFNYNNFNLELDSATTNFFYLKKDIDTDKGAGKAYYKLMASDLNDITGIIQIDTSINRSGKKEFKDFPYMATTQHARIYYDDNKTKGGVYNRGEFYFDVQKFKRTNLNNLSELVADTADNSRLAFSGTMKTGEIFKAFEDTVTVQKDGSFGFVHKTDGDDRALFGGKGEFMPNDDGVSTVTLSNKGFGGAGRIKYSTVIIDSDIFNFYPDSMQTRATNFKIQKNPNADAGVEYPTVEGEKVLIQWDAKEDVINIDAKEKPLKMYDKKVTLIGTAKYTTKGLSGVGTIKMDEGVLTSEKLDLKENTMYSDSVNFIMKTFQGKKAVVGKNLKAFFDIKQGVSVFEAKPEGSELDFILTKFKNKPEHFVWYQGKRMLDINYNIDKINADELKGVVIDKNKLYEYKFSNSLYANVPDTSAEYATTITKYRNKDNDILHFKGTKSTYKIYKSGKNRLTIDGVKLIKVADITVAPKRNINIYDNARFKEFNDATIKVGIHNITKVKITIKNASQYEASSGIFLYARMGRLYSNGKQKPKKEEIIQQVQFSKIHYSIKDSASVAQGNVPDSVNFLLSDYFRFKGDVNFNAKFKNLQFTGYSKITKESCSNKNEWFNFTTSIDPANVVLPIAQKLVPKVKSKENVYAGINLLKRNPTEIESMFLTKDTLKNYGGAYNVFRAMGEQFIFHENGKYKIATKERIGNDTAGGNYMSYDYTRCVTQAEGKFTPFEADKLGFDFYGEYRDDKPNDERKLDGIMLVDFFLSDNLVDIMQNELIADSALRLRGDIGIELDETYKRRLKYILNEEEFSRLLKDFDASNGTDFMLPKKLSQTLFLTNLDMVWDVGTNSFKSLNNSVSIGGVSRKLINKKLTGYVQLKINRKGNSSKDELYVYFEINDKDYFYFRFNDKQVEIFSTVKEFDAYYQDKLASKSKARKDYRNYDFYWGNTEAVEKFIREFKMKNIVVTPVDTNEDEDTDDDTGVEDTDGE